MSKRSKRKVGRTQSIANLPSLEGVGQLPPEKTKVSAEPKAPKARSIPQETVQQEIFSSNAARDMLEEILGQKLRGYQK